MYRNAINAEGWVEREEALSTVSLGFHWTSIGPVFLDGSERLVFPDTHRAPGVYRLEFSGADAQAVYIGETENLARRFQHYRAPGPSQKTNIRLNELMKRHLKQGGNIVASIIVRHAVVKLGDDETPIDMNLKFQRVLLESAAISTAHAGGQTLLNR